MSEWVHCKIRIEIKSRASERASEGVLVMGSGEVVMKVTPGTAAGAEYTVPTVRDEKSWHTTAPWLSVTMLTRSASSSASVEGIVDVEGVVCMRWMCDGGREEEKRTGGEALLKYTRCHRGGRGERGEERWMCAWRGDGTKMMATLMGRQRL